MASNSFKVKNSLHIAPSSQSTSEAGDLRVRLSDNKVVVHDGVSEVAILRDGDPVSTDADLVAFDNASSGLAATDVQAAIDEVEARLDVVEAIPIGANRSLSNLTIPSLAATDVIVGAGAASIGRLPAGANGEVLTVVGGTPAWAPASGGGANTSLSNLTIPSLAAEDVILGNNATSVKRLAVGSNGQFLQVAGGQVVWATASIPSSASDVSFTPAGNIAATNVQAAIVELDNEKQPAGSYATTALNNLALSGLTAEDLIVGNNGTSVKRLGIGTNNQVLTVSASQVSWQSVSTVELPIITAWTSFSCVIGATGTAPTFGTVDNIETWYRRVGDTMEIIANFSWSDNTGANNGSGTYLFPIPSGETIDSAKLIISPTLGMSIVGDARWGGVDTDVPADTIVYDSTNLALLNNDAIVAPDPLAGTDGLAGSASPKITFNAKIPISGWAATQTIKVIS